MFSGVVAPCATIPQDATTSGQGYNKKGRDRFSCREKGEACAVGSAACILTLLAY